ncbi:uncharacterized protein MONBRDRAFT_22778 [Monosiga brevicollis MX1]|uniref:Uncharacterized protein n=1 Tax=Monosiga brevicollis TaxID=81824 RepID=A9US22_MONBE|nr:uncharacterized protein MONBRDRAFT_22778 [Monosiga brevicollis MX1]EDQ91703.1 predicted protein [Monosiga brevicollis MX1]|eukprot:XP_001742989.1 hypothetical protein [Monosiga brevicollis MX1]
MYKAACWLHSPTVASAGEIITQQNQADLRSSYENFGVSEVLKLPAAVGNVYLGQTLSCLISVHNEGSESVSSIVTKVELQTGSKRTSLKPTLTGERKGQEVGPIGKLAPGQAIDQIVEYQLQDPAVHIMVCILAYTSQDGDRKQLRKHFKFEVTQPLEIVPLCKTLKDDVMVQVNVQNIAKEPLILEYVRMTPTKVYTCEETDEPPSPDQQLPVSKTRNRIFVLKPQPTVDARTFKQSAKVGQVMVSWRAMRGGRGYTSIATIQRRVPTLNDVHLDVLDPPDSVQVGTLCTLRVRIINFTDRQYTLGLSYNPEQVTELVVMPLRTGSHKLQNVLLKDIRSGSHFTTNFPANAPLRDLVAPGAAHCAQCRLSPNGVTYEAAREQAWHTINRGLIRLQVGTEIHRNNSSAPSTVRKS